MSEALNQDRAAALPVRRFRVPLAREGYTIMAGAVAVTAILFLAGWVFPAFGALALTAFVVSFFRDPERRIPTETGLVVAPADGRVIKVEIGRASCRERV